MSRCPVPVNAFKLMWNLSLLPVCLTNQNLRSSINTRQSTSSRAGALLKPLRNTAPIPLPNSWYICSSTAFSTSDPSFKLEISLAGSSWVSSGRDVTHVWQTYRRLSPHSCRSLICRYIASQSSMASYSIFSKLSSVGNTDFASVTFQSWRLPPQWCLWYRSGGKPPGGTWNTC